ncbi:MAG TPA: LexA family transcriptional regulator [Salinivirgaceae bacterium]|nr:LexA family transcriptional regulator [Salinivirgaceae bacterium]
MRKRRKRTQDEVAVALQMKRSTLSGYENRVAQPSVEVLLAFSEYFGITVDTLLKVDLSTLRESELSELERGNDIFVRGGRIRILTTTVTPENKENIELVPEKAKAGYVTGYADPEYIGELPVFQLPFLERSKKYRTFQISGDSMLPISDGSWITGEFVEDWFTIKDATPCVVLTLNDGIVFKILNNFLVENREFEFVSLNPLYKPYRLHVSEILEIWRFVHIISNTFPAPEVSVEHLYFSLETVKEELRNLRNSLESMGKP